MPDSHTPEATARFKRAHPQYDCGGLGADWCPLRNPDRDAPPAVLLLAKAGDLILWDSRTLHGGRVGQRARVSGTIFRESSTDEGTLEQQNTPPVPVELARLAVTVCMTPKALASPGVLRAREKGYQKGCTFTHWPHEAIMTAMYPPPSGSRTAYQPVELPSRVLELIS